MNTKLNEKDIYKNIKKALEILEIPGGFVSMKEIKEHYKKLSKRYHPDFSKENKYDKMQEINWAYNVLREYVERYRYTFDEDEVKKQYPESYYADKFRF